jgi:hypothetical protein
MKTPDGIDIYIEWDKMEVGHSFYITTFKNIKLYEMLEIEGRKHGYKMVYRGAKENGTFGIRVWRVG